MVNYFEKEHFEHWVSQQPEGRTWNYMDNRGCVVCAYMKEHHGVSVACGGNYIVFERDGRPLDVIAMPGWLWMELGTLSYHNKRKIPARELKRVFCPPLGTAIPETKSTNNQEVTTKLC